MEEEGGWICKCHCADFRRCWMFCNEVKGSTSQFTMSNQHVQHLQVTTSLSPSVSNVDVELFFRRCMKLRIKSKKIGNGEENQRQTSHPRIAHGQRYPMPCWEWSTEEVEWELGRGPKRSMSCRTWGKFPNVLRGQISGFRWLMAYLKAGGQH